MTCNGTVALEYQSFGKKVLVAENAYYNHFGFKKIPKNINEYINLLENLERLKNPNKSQVIKAKTFFYIKFFFKVVKSIYIFTTYTF